MSGTAQNLPDRPDWRWALWSVLKLPVQIFLLGGSVLLLLWLASRAGTPGTTALLTALGTSNVLANLAAVLVFLVGIGFAVFLWWLASRYFAMIHNKELDKDAIASMSNLPMALPEGTVRAVLALIVAVIGLPLLLFSASLGLSDAIAGYVNGIVTGVFGFYFGTRTTGVPAQAVEKISDAERRAGASQAAAAGAQQQVAAAQQERNQAVAEAQTSKAIAAQAQGVAGLDSTLATVNRHLAMAKTALTVFGPLLPAGTLPAQLPDAIALAEKAVSAVGNNKDTVTTDQLTDLQAAADQLTGGASPLSALLKQAAPLLTALPIPGIGMVAGLATVLALGVKMGADGFKRWRARVLAAPLAQGLVEFGTVTPELVHAALERSPTLLRALEPAMDDPGFDATLADIVLRDNAPDLLLEKFGGEAEGRKLIADRAQAAAGIAELRQALLDMRSVNDVPASKLAEVTGTLANASADALKAVPSGLTQEQAHALIGAVSGVSANAAAPLDQRAAFDALVALVDYARRDNVDLATAFSELKP
ncbi:MAG TPA: hypothetical protein VGC80_00870 [Acetobacteraceae bacterium]